jgi:arsenical pump membrane protein
VAGLLLIGAVAASDGLFEAIGSRLAAIPGNGLVLFALLMFLVVGVTVVLNLDTSVVFLTPIVLHAARRRGIPESAFLYGVVFVSNSASLLLPGSNLTNLLVLLPEHLSGGRYAGRIAPAWAAAVVVTMVVVIVWRRRDLGAQETGAMTTVPFRAGFGMVGVVAATVSVLEFENPALAVAATGVVVAAAQVARGRLGARSAGRALSALTLGGIFAVAVALGTLARLWGGPGRLMTSIGAWPTAFLGAGASAAVNNLPAAVLLSARPPSHPLALLIGLDLGPNLVVWGALSAILWLRVARAEGAAPSARTYSLVGLVVVPASMTAAVALLDIGAHAAS